MAMVVVGAVATAFAMYTVNTALVVVAAGLHNSRSPIAVWVESAAADLRQTSALYAAGFILAMISDHMPWLALVMMIPIGGGRLSRKPSMQLPGQTGAPVGVWALLVDPPLRTTVH